MKRNLLFALLLLGIKTHAQNCIPNTSSLNFDGTSTYVDLSTNNDLDVTDSVTIEAWIYSNSWGATSAQNTIVCKHGWSAGEQGYVLRAGGTGELSFNIACDSAGTNVSWRELVSGTAALQLNHWHHVAGTFNGTEMKIYIDGMLAGTRTFGAPVNIIQSFYGMKIGRLADMAQSDTRFWNGMIDEVRIWHRALDQTQISQNMSTHIDQTTASGLISYFRMNENTGATLSDLGTGNNSATIYNGTWSTNVPFTQGPVQPYITIGSGYYLTSSAATGNQWNLDGTPIPGATNQGYQPTQNGSYTVTVTDSDSCSATSPPYIASALGIEETNQSIRLLQSNDVKNILKFAMPEATLTKSELRIYDVTGKEVCFLSKENISKEVQIDLKSGVYFVALTNESANYSEKIIVH
jgi:hypothetical protein